jgi:hypothetical protein
VTVVSATQITATLCRAANATLGAANATDDDPAAEPLARDLHGQCAAAVDFGKPAQRSRGNSVP